MRAQTTWTGTPTNDVAFVYDGWNLVAVLNATNHAELQAFVWGLDLSGSMEGADLPRQSEATAGGVGGLIAVDDVAGGSGFHFAAFDGNGNVCGLVKASDATASAAYEYGPFGEVIRATGSEAAANPFRFSTKYRDEESGLLYYGYRYYDASLGRWVSRDPISETGGRNLHRFAANNPLDHWDYLGLIAPAPPNPIPTPPPRACNLSEWLQCGWGCAKRCGFPSHCKVTFKPAVAPSIFATPVITCWCKILWP